MADFQIILLFAIFIISCIIAVVVYIIQHRQLKRYEQIYIGMSESQMLSIMGGRYNVSSLRNNRKKYEWRINSYSYGQHGYRSYSGVKKVDIYLKDGHVEEIRPYNV